MQRTSPPTPVARAARSVITPREVETIATPRPFMTVRDVVAALVDAQARARDALDLLDHGLAGVVLEADLDHGLAVGVAHREVLDVALVLQHLRDGALHLRCRHAARSPSRWPARCGCASACRRWDHSCSSSCSYQLALIIPGISPRIAISRILLRPRPNLRNVPRGRPGDGAAVAQAHRRGVARQRLQLRARLVLRLVGRLRVLDDRRAAACASRRTSSRWRGASPRG